MATITTVPVMYRDADNYKWRGHIELMGALSSADRKAILDTLEDGTDFIPTEVGLLHVGQQKNEDGFGTDADHVFNTLLLDEAEEEQVSDFPSELPTVEQFIAALQQASAHGWNTAQAMEELGL